MRRRPIVYSARYYSSPKQPDKPSYWHLYRIQPDGTSRLQLTHDPADDRSPLWSPDGKWIAFQRTRKQNRESSGPVSVCVCDPEGAVRVLYTSPEGDLEYRWRDRKTLLVHENRYSPNRPQLYYQLDVTTGQHLSQTEADWWHTEATSPDGTVVFVNDPPRLIHLPTRKITPIPRTVFGAVWLSNMRLLCLTLESEANEGHTLVELGRDGKVLKTWRETLSEEARVFMGGSAVPFCHLTALPKERNVLVGSGFGGTSMGRWYHFVRVDLATHRAEPWGIAADLSFSPDGSQFVTTYNRELVPYGQTGKELYVQPLLVARSKSAQQQKEIVRGLVYVESADWCPVI